MLLSTWLALPAAGKPAFAGLPYNVQQQIVVWKGAGGIQCYALIYYIIYPGVVRVSCCRGKQG